MPKFGYTYLIPNKIFIFADQRMCAILNSITGKCLKYYYRFLPVQGENYSIFFKDFINFDRVSQESHSKEIKCEQGYELKRQFNVDGCIQQEDDVFCLRKDKFSNCQECVPNYAINAQTGKCQFSTTQDCLFQIISNLNNRFSQCLLCKKGFHKESSFLSKCTETQICEQYSDTLPYQCQFCSTAGRECEGEYRNCGQFFFKEGTKSCNRRDFSQSCKTNQTHPLGDYCNTTESNGNYFIDINQDILPRRLLPLKIISPQDYIQLYFKILRQTKNFGQAQQYYESIGIPFYFPSQTSNVKGLSRVEGCLEYSPIEDTCLLCEEGKNIWRENGRITCRDAVSLPPLIAGCYMYDANSRSCLKCEKNQLDCQYPKIENCIHWFEDGCLKCEEGFYLTKFENHFGCQKKVKLCQNYGYQNNSNKEDCTHCLQGFQFKVTEKIENKLHTCVENINNCKKMVEGECEECSDGFILNLETKECLASQKFINCKQVNSQNSCISCKKYYTLHEGRCLLNWDQSYCQNKRGCIGCIKDFSNQCFFCSEGYQLTDKKCYYQCQTSSGLYEYQQSCPYQSLSPCDSSCLSCVFNKSIECYTCREGYFLNYGRCIQGTQCSSRQFFSKEQQECQQCPPQCGACISDSQCIACISPEKSKNSLCKCNLTQIYHDNKCLEDCYYGWKKSTIKANICERVCPDYEYLEVVDYTFKCISTSQKLDNYCNQLIWHIPNLVSVTIDRQYASYSDDNIALLITLSETPEQCFTFKIFDENDFEYRYDEIQSSLHEVTLLVNISKQKVLDSKKSHGDLEQYIYMFLKIIYKGISRLTIKIKLNLAFDIILVDEISDMEFISDIDTSNEICINCDIPIAMQIPSSASANCTKNLDSSPDKISWKLDEVIEIIQKVNDLNFQNRTIEPHSFILTIYNSTHRNYDILDYPHSFNSSQPGQITYQFSVIVESINATLKIVSKVRDFKINRLLSSQKEKINSSYKYLVQKFHFEIDQQIEESSSSFLICFIIIIIVSSILALAILIPKIIKRRKQYIQFIDTENKQNIMDNLDSQNGQKEIEIQPIQNSVSNQSIMQNF